MEKKQLYARDSAPVFDLCNARERRFLLDLVAQEEPGALDDHPMPELYALLRAMERMWGGADATKLTAPPQLIFHMAVCSAYLHHVPEDVERWRAGAAHDIHQILQGLMESVALAIQDGSVVKRKDDGASIDLFRIPQWFYNKVMSDEWPL
jgi:hypothetical protein